MDLTSTRRRLLMPDPNDPLDPANIDKMLEERMKGKDGHPIEPRMATG